MKMIKTLIITFAVFLLLIAVSGFFIAPAVLKPFITKKLTETLNREARMEKLSINPFTVSVTVRGFSLTEPGQPVPFIAFEKMHVNIDAVMSVFRRALILTEIGLDAPYVGLMRRPDGTYNFTDLIHPEKPEKDGTKPFLFSLNNIRIADGQIDFRDIPKNTDHSVRELNISIPFISNMEYYMKQYVEPQFSAVVNGHSILAKGQTQPFITSRDTRFDLDIQDIDLPHYLEYLPVKMNFKLTSARLDTKLGIHFIRHDNQSPALTVTGGTTLKKVVLDDLQGNKLLRLESLRIDITKIRPLALDIHLAKVALNAPDMVIRRDGQGQINWFNLVGDHKGTPDRHEASVQATGKNEWLMRIDDLIVDKGAVTLIDSLPAQTVNLSVSPFDLRVENISTRKGDNAKVNLAATVNQRSRLSMAGEFGIHPVMADLAMDLSPLAIRPFQPYFTDTVKMDITGGAVSTAGNVKVALAEKSVPVIRYTGDVFIHNLATIDQVHALDFLKFKKISVLALSAGYNPIFLNVREIRLDDFFAKLVINQGGTTNLQDIFSASEEKPVGQPQSSQQAKQTAEPDQPAPPADIVIGKVSFHGGTLDFTDRNISPNYSATMLNLKGSVTGLSSKEITRARMDLKGNLGYGSPIEISGTVNPLIKDFFADIKVSFKDIEMSSTSPYTARYLGYPITKGKLHFDVSYRIDHKKLTAENKLFFDQLTFGDKVESPDAITAPVTLAVSLLTDRQGQINLDIPITGSLDDPEFRILPIIWQIITNLITRAVTSPFSLLSSLTGGGDEMSFVEFAFGSAELSGDEQRKIIALAKALYDRPNLKLEIEAYIDAVQDQEALKNAEFDRLIKVQIFRENAAEDRTPVPLEEIVIPQADYHKYLTLAYKSGKFSKPRNAIGMLKELPPAEMEKLLRDHITITNDDLERLAVRRASAVRQGLLQEGNIDPARIFMVKPKSLTPEKKEKIKDSRVEFKIK
jgi:uncharacterized protein involved in outer membrane biogenesis